MKCYQYQILSLSKLPVDLKQLREKLFVSPLKFVQIFYDKQVIVAKLLYFCSLVSLFQKITSLVKSPINILLHACSETFEWL